MNAPLWSTRRASVRVPAQPPEGCGGWKLLPADAVNGALSEAGDGLAPESRWMNCGFISRPARDNRHSVSLARMSESMTGNGHGDREEQRRCILHWICCPAWPTTSAL